jgi:hypothetical protein
LTVNSGATLVIEVGTTINLKTYTIQVFGTLTAKEDLNDRVTLEISYEANNEY